MRNKDKKIQFNSIIDSHILGTFLFRGWNVFAGLATLFFISIYFSPIEQGYYYTFASLLALQVFFELGLNQILVQLVSHEVAHLKETSEGRFSGRESHLDRLSSLVKFIGKWYSVAALLFLLIAGISGSFFLSQKIEQQNITMLIGIWAVLVLATAINLWLSPKFAMIEGCGRVGQVAQLRLIQSILGYVFFWLLLLYGAGLWAITALPIINAVCSSWWLNIRGSVLNWLYKRSINPVNKIIWRSEIFPLQWRISISWMSGFFIFNLFTPMTFMHQGVVEAGQLGMTLSIFGAIVTVGMSWVNAKTPVFTMLIAKGEKNMLKKLFQSLFLRSTIFIALASICIVFAMWYLERRGIAEVRRISSINTLVVIGVITIANSIVFCMAAFMRAYREEPMLMQSVTVATLVAVAIFIGSTYSVLVMMSLYMLICLFISLPWTVWLYLKYLKR